MNTIESINNLKKSIESQRQKISSISKKGNERKQEILDKAKRACEEIEQDCKNQTKEIEKDLTKNQQKLKSFQNKLKNITTFDTTYVGNLVASLVTAMEGEEYVFIRPCIIKRNIYQERYGYECVTDVFTGLLITKSTYRQPTYEEEVYFNDKMHIEKSDNFIIFGWENQKETSLWKSFSEEVVKSKYSYIIDFINYIISYCDINNIDHLEEKETTSLMKAFVQENKPISRKRKQ